MARSVNGHSMGLSLTVSESKNPLKPHLTEDKSALFQDECFSEVDSVASTSSKGRNVKNGSFSSYEGSASDAEANSVKTNGRCKGKRRNKVHESELPEKRLRTRHDGHLKRYSKKVKKNNVNVSKKPRQHKKQISSSSTSELQNNNVGSTQDYNVISESQSSNSAVHHSSFDTVKGPSSLKHHFNEENEFLNGSAKVADAAKVMAAPEKNTLDENTDSLAASSMKQALEKKLKTIIDSPESGSKSVSATNLITTLSEKLSSKLANAVTKRSSITSELHNDGIADEATPEKNKMKMPGPSLKNSPFLESFKKKVSMYSPLSKWTMSPKTPESNKVLFTDQIEEDCDLPQNHRKETATQMHLEQVSHPLLLRDSNLVNRSGKSNVYDAKSISITKKYNYINFENESPSSSSDNSREQEDRFQPVKDKMKSSKKKSSCSSSMQKNMLLSVNEWDGAQFSELKFRKSTSCNSDSDAQEMQINSSGDSVSGIDPNSKSESHGKKLTSLRKELEQLIQESKLKEFPIKAVKKSRLRNKTKKKKTECERLLQSLSETKNPLPINPKRKRTEKNAMSEKALSVKLQNSQNNLNATSSVNSTSSSNKSLTLTAVSNNDITISQSSLPTTKSKAPKHLKKINCKLIKKSPTISKKIKVNKNKKNKKLNTPLIAKRKNAIKVQLNLDKKKNLEKQLKSSKENGSVIPLVNNKSAKLGSKSKDASGKTLQRKDGTVKALAKKQGIHIKLNTELKINKEKAKKSSNKPDSSSGFTFKNVKYRQTTLGSWKPVSVSGSSQVSKSQEASTNHSDILLKQAQEVNLNKQALTVTVTPLRSIDIARALHLQPSKKISKRKTSVDLAKRISVRQTESSYKYKGISLKIHENFFQIILLTGYNNSRNALSPQILKELKLALNAALKDTSCKMVLLNGTGSIFCTGIDLKYLMRENKETRYKVATDMIVALKGFLHTLLTFPKPIVVAVNGIAVGLGVTLLPLCDIIYASDKATFLTPYAKLCQTPEGGATCTFPQLLDMTTANEMLLGGRRITAEQASHCGLVSQVFWPSRLLEEVIPRVQIMASQNGQAMQATKALLRAPMKAKLEEAIENECRLLLDQWCSVDCQRAIKQFLEAELL